MKAIETAYKGYRFRSRLEARWAVFYDALGIEYRYEAEGFDLDGVWYLPDFWLPTLDAWVEIKGREPTSTERNRMEALVAATQREGFLFFGDCWLPEFGSESAISVISAVCPEGDTIVAEDDGHYWSECTDCGALAITGRGDSERIPLTASCAHDNGGAQTPRLRAAYEAARSARFDS